MNLQEFTQKQKRITTIAQVALVAIAAFIVVPIVVVVAKAVAGIATAIILGGVAGLSITSFSPWLSMKFANWKLKAIKHEAARNPVETLQNVYNQRNVQREAFKKKITTFRARVQSYEDKVESFKEGFPQDAGKFELQLQQMRLLLSRRDAKYLRVKQDLEQFALVIARADAIWKMTLDAAAMNEAAGEFDGEQTYERIKVETSLDSIQDALNMTFAEMESDLLEGDDVDIKLIESQPVNAINTVNLNIKEQVA